MFIMKRIIIILLAVLLQISAPKASEKPLSIAVNAGPPWAFYDEELGVIGIDVDIISRVVERLGYKSEFHLLVYNRLIEDFRNGKFDIASPAAFSAREGALTVPYLPFEDVAVSLQSKNLSIEQLDDLAGKSVVAYQSARHVLGTAFTAVLTDDHYLEIADREVQLRLLANERADVVIGERRILTYIMNKYYPDKALRIHQVFEATPYGAIARNTELRDKFNAELEKMRESGELTRILNKWQ